MRPSKGILFLLLFTLFVSPQSIADDKPCNGDSFVVSAPIEPLNLIPLLATDSTSAEISRLIFNGLLKYDEAIELTGDLAERWEVKDDGLRIIFYLRKNVTWQDGAPFTAEDVLFTYAKLTDPSVPTPYGAEFDKIKSVRALNPYTVEVVYREPFSPALASWCMGILPKHLLAKEDLLKTSFSRSPVGTGPYQIKKWVTGQYLELGANPNYFEGRPHIDRYLYRIIPDATSAFLELETENLDLMSLSPLQFKKLTESRFFKEKYQKFQYPNFGYTFLAYNLQNPLFSDVRVRKAIGCAVNKQEIVDVVLLGSGRVSTGPFLPGMWAANPEVGETVSDPEKARKLLAEAGWSAKDSGGILVKDGKRFSFTILTVFGNDQRKMACEIIQRRLKEIGIEVKIQVVEWSVFLKEFVGKKRFEALCLGWHLSFDPDIYEIFHSSKTKPGEFNFIGYKNAEVDRLLNEGRREFDIKKRTAIYQRVHALIAEDEPYTFLYVPDALPIVHKRFRGVHSSPIGIGYNFIHWFVPKNEQRYSFRGRSDQRAGDVADLSPNGDRSLRPQK